MKILIFFVEMSPWSDSEFCKKNIATFLYHVRLHRQLVGLSMVLNKCKNRLGVYSHSGIYAQTIFTFIQNHGETDQLSMQSNEIQKCGNIFFLQNSKSDQGEISKKKIKIFMNPIFHISRT